MLSLSRCVFRPVLQRLASSSRHSDLRHRRPMASAAPDVPADMDFSKERLLSSLETCVSDDGDISVDMYVAVIEEMYRLMKWSGREFLHNLKILLYEAEMIVSLLKDYREGPSGEHYSTVQSMIDHELRNNLIHSDSRPSGTHTLLRCHRTMEFICNMLEKIQDLTIPDKEFQGEMVKSYTETLGHFKPDLMVTSILWALPAYTANRKSYIEMMGFAKDPSEFWIWVRLVTDNLKRVYDAVHTIYGRHQILKLPGEEEESTTCL